MEECKIYVLKDPRTKEVKYVGRTSNSLNGRLCKHINEAEKYDASKNNKKLEWISELLSIGCKPIIKQVECVSVKESAEKELQWIAYYKSKSCKLVNLSGTVHTDKLIVKNKNKSEIKEVTRGMWGGRKPLDDKKRKILLSISPEQGVVDAIGGMEKAKEIAFAAIEREYFKINKS